MLKQIPVFAVFVRADPAAFRRLCVETTNGVGFPSIDWASRLQAAVC